MSARSTQPSSRALTLLFSSLLFVAAILVCFVLTTPSAQAASSHVDVMTLNGEINQASLRFLTQSIATAQHDGAQALVIEIDTPGGDIDSMKSMTQAELASKVPIIAYVSPTGGRAASAGAFVTLAAQVTAMAPTTRIGASSPVTGSGSDIQSTLKSKIENDLVASITGIQRLYGRNQDLAKAMVTQAKSYDDVTAAQSHLVDIGADGAPSLPALLNTVNGRSVTFASGQTMSLQTAGVSVQTLEESPLDTFYTFIIDPNIVFLLFIIAMIGIYLEISHPGAIVPGVTGAIALLLFLFAVGSLTPNWAGLALMVLAFVLLVLDVRLPTHGVLTIGAVIALITGALLFFNSGGPYDGAQIAPLTVYIMGAVVGFIGLALVAFIVRAQRMRVTTGVEGMIGTKVVARTGLFPQGRVSYGGEDWAAILDEPYTSADEGAELLITAVEGLRLHVRPVLGSPLVDVHHSPELKY